MSVVCPPLTVRGHGVSSSLTNVYLHCSSALKKENKVCLFDYKKCEHEPSDRHYDELMWVTSTEPLFIHVSHMQPRTLMDRRDKCEDMFSVVVQALWAQMFPECRNNPRKKQLVVDPWTGQWSGTLVQNRRLNNGTRWSVLSWRCWRRIHLHLRAWRSQGCILLRPTSRTPERRASKLQPFALVL